MVEKMQNKDQNFIGVYTSKAKIVINVPNNQKNLENGVTAYTMGKCLISIIGHVQAGQKISYSNKMLGVAKQSSGQEKSFAISLESSTKEEEKLIWCLIQN